MAIKTFTTGEVLTASDTNTYLANSGLVYITEATLGSGVTSVSVANCFDATYDNYLIQMSGGTGSANTVANFRLGATVSGYRYSFIYTSWNSTVSGNGSTTSTTIQYVGSLQTSGSTASITVMSPYLATPTRVVADGSSLSNYSGTAQGFEPNSTSYTGFTILADSGTRTGGIVTVYGFRKA
jgi:hypothetical protein